MEQCRSWTIPNMHFLGIALLFGLFAVATSWADEKQVVSVIVPERKPMLQVERAVGELNAVRRASLQMRNKGTLDQLLVQEGERIEKGQLLAVLELAPYQLALDASDSQLAAAQAQVRAAETATAVARSAVPAAQARFDLAKREFERAAKLLNNDSVTRQQYDRAEGEYNMAIAGLDVAKKQVSQAEAGLELAKKQVDVAKVGQNTAKQKLEDSKLTAPFSGIVVSRPTQEHEMIGDRSVLYMLVDDTELELVAKLPEKFLPSVTPGTKLLISSELCPEPRTATVTAVITAIDPTSRTFTFKSRFQNPDGILRPGGYADVDVVLADRQDALTLPVEAVRFDQGSRSSGAVFVVRDGKAVGMPVKLGIEREGRIELTRGVTTETQVILRGLSAISDGTFVEIATERAKE